MRSLLTLISDDSLLNRIKLMLHDNTIKYYFASSGEEAANIASANEIAAVILDYINPVMTGPEICEMILSYNPDTQFIMFFDEKYQKVYEIDKSYPSKVIRIDPLISPLPYESRS